jgi:deoxyribodipyrimidine photo-lyase
MSREQRVQDNWALLAAQDAALARQRGLVVVFTLTPSFPDASVRHYDFLLRGLAEVSQELAGLDIPFLVLCGHPPEELGAFLDRLGPALLVSDFDPAPAKRQWVVEVASQRREPMVEVDSRNVVPCRLASQKAEWGAYTLRPRYHKLLPHFLTPIPALLRHPFPASVQGAFPLPELKASLRAVYRDAPVSDLEPGARSAARQLQQFLTQGLPFYAQRSNDPNASVCSHLSAHLHFGQLSAQRIALAVQAAPAPQDAKDAYLEQLLVRRELADNFCWYNPRFASPAGFPDWARATLDLHRADVRPHLYQDSALENGETHDPLWNAAQHRLALRGHLEGYLRMYWAKKILEWTDCPEHAFELALRLNNRWLLDGRDSNGYVGVAWAIGGVHDRPWSERPIFGKVRYMNLEGCRRKFKVDDYIAHSPRPVAPLAD